jgi:pimeloyl-ACP methyl ester carboxylesterase
MLRWMAVVPAEGRERYEDLMEKVAVPNPKVVRDDELRRISVTHARDDRGKEKICDARAALARADALIPGVRTLSIPDASHDLMFSQPARVNAALSSFLVD